MATNNEKLISAIREGKLSKVKAYVRQGISIDAPIELDYGTTFPLTEAIRSGNREIVDYLIGEGATVTAYEVNGKVNNPVRAALDRADFAILDAVIKAGGDLSSVTTAENDNALTYLAKNAINDRNLPKEDFDKIADYLVAQGVDINYTNSNGESAISILLDSNYSEYFLGKDLDLSNKKVLKDLFELAIRVGDVQTLKRYIENGADINQKIDGEDFYPIGFAVAHTKNNREEIVETLLNAGSNVDLLNYTAQTSFERAITNYLIGDYQNKEKAFANLKLMIEKGSSKTGDPTLSVVNFGRELPLTLSINTGNVEVLDLLLENGADPNLYYHDVRTAGFSSIPPIIFAMDRDNSVEIVGKLLDHGAKLEYFISKDDKTPEFSVMSKLLSNENGVVNRDNLVKLIIQRNLVDLKQILGEKTYFEHILDLELTESIKAINSSNVKFTDLMQDPISYAIANNKIESLKALFATGEFDVNARFGENRTTYLIEAIKNNNLNIAKALIEIGADIKAKTIDGRSAIDFAVKSSNLDAVQLLFAHGAELKPDRNFSTRELIAFASMTVDKKSSELANALKKGDTKRALKLLDMGADLYVNISKKGMECARDYLFNGKNDYVIEQLMYDTSINYDFKIDFSNYVIESKKYDLIDSLLKSPRAYSIDDVLANAVSHDNREFISVAIEKIKAGSAKVQLSQSLLNATTLGKLDVVKELCEVATLEEKFVYDMLTLATKKGNSEMAEYALSLGAKIEAPVVEEAIKSGNPEIISTILASSKQKFKIDFKNIEASVFTLAKRGETKALLSLQKAGVLNNITPNEAFNILYNALDSNNLNVVRALNQADPQFAKVSRAMLTAAVNRDYIEGVNNLQKRELARKLAQAGVDATTLTTHNNRTLMIVEAIKHYDTRKVDELIDLGVDASTRDESGKTILEIALNAKNLKAVRKLAKHGAKLTTQAEVDRLNDILISQRGKYWKKASLRLRENAPVYQTER